MQRSQERRELCIEEVERLERGMKTECCVCVCETTRQETVDCSDTDD